MELKPVKNNVKPKYPLKYELKDETLKSMIPKRWASSPAAKAALGALAVITLAGCAAEGMSPSAIPTKDAAVLATEDPAIGVVYPGEAMASVINVAPLFIHGEGRGTYGCDMVTSPAYISEYEALTVINEVAEEYGLKFSDEDKAEFSTVLRPVTHYREPEAGAAAPPDVFITLKTDFSDNEHGVALEYITVEDVKSWCKDSPGLIDQYDTKDAAAQLSEALENAGPKGIYNAGVLYDPCELSEDEAAAKALAQEELKAQAKDFFEWLKARGVI